LPWSKSNAQDAFGPNGWDPVSISTSYIFTFTKNSILVTDYSKSRLTNDGNAILREIEVAHPAAKNMIELSRTQDEEVGDGTTSVIILGA
jgi:TCP-1/cpn60 chaperonin family